MKYLIFICFTLFSSQMAMGQKPVPAPEQSRPVALTGGLAHLGNGEVIENSIITFDNGKLTNVLDFTVAKIDLSGHEVINISGKQVYPGFILPNSQVGLEEVGAVRSMVDASELGDLNPNVKSYISYNADSEFPPTFRFNGVLLAETTPRGGTISGTSSLMEMEGWNWEDALHSADIGVHVNWPSIHSPEFDTRTFTVSYPPNKDYDKKVVELEQFFKAAFAYGFQSNKEVNLKMEAMQGLMDGSKILFLHARHPKEIISSVRSAQRAGVSRITLITGSGSLQVAEFLKENGIPVILSSTHNLPDRVDDDIDLPYKLPHLLTEAGVVVSLQHDGMLHGSRNLGFFAGTAAAYGMSKEEALKTITSNTAKALGVDQRLGTLEYGKDATLFVSEGDALDYRTNNLTHVFISGKSVILPGNQQELYERYSRKYGQMD